MNGNQQWKPEPIGDSHGPTSRTQPQPQPMTTHATLNEGTTRPNADDSGNQRPFQPSIRPSVHGGYSPHDQRQRVQRSDGEVNPTNQMQRWTQTQQRRLERKNGKSKQTTTNVSSRRRRIKPTVDVSTHTKPDRTRPLQLDDNDREFRREGGACPPRWSGEEGGNEDAERRVRVLRRRRGC